MHVAHYSYFTEKELHTLYRNRKMIRHFLNDGQCDLIFDILPPPALIGQLKF